MHQPTRAKHLSSWLLYLLVISISAHAAGSTGTLRVAVATNFVPSMKQLSNNFESEHNVAIHLSSSSSGKLYAQIRQGKEVDVFLSADQRYIRRLIEDGFGMAESQRTYAIGVLALWIKNPHTSMTTAHGIKIDDVYTFALAQPKVAPYGEASVQAITNCIQFEPQPPKFVYGENVGQTYSFLATGNADAGLVAQSTIASDKSSQTQHIVTINANCHEPIVQDLVILKDSSDPNLAQSFVDFLLSIESQQIIRSFGYTTK